MVNALDSGASARVLALAGDIVLCSWARHFTLTAPRCINGYRRTYCQGVTLHSIKGGVEILVRASCYGNRDKLRPDESLGLYADCTYTYIISSIWNQPPMQYLQLLACQTRQSRTSDSEDWLTTPVYLTLKKLSDLKVSISGNLAVCLWTAFTWLVLLFLLLFVGLFVFSSVCRSVVWSVGLGFSLFVCLFVCFD